ncbi:MAG TPA: response regulator transcription factor [Burkholderiales bacterium]|nr:response regulator transcription factor [Burkholderiales bacterium]
MSRLRVILADDHTLVRAGLRSLLGQLPEVEVVAETGDGREVLALVPRHRPDIVLMDITMPGMNGLEATAHLRKDHPGVKVVILSMHASEEYVLQALRAGAAGYLLKDSATLELALALQAVARGETYLSPPISRQVVENYMRRVGEDVRPLAALTARQREILQLIAEGASTKDIARRLELSVKTVESHRAQLMERLGIHDVAGLVRFAIRHGLVSPEK